MSFVIGDFLVWQGQGVVRVEGTRDHNGESFWVMKTVETCTTIMTPASTVDSVVRPLASHDEAERLVGVLKQPLAAADERPWLERFHDNMVTLVKRPLDAQVHALHALYQTPYALTFGERQLIDTIERVVVGELAHVLDKTVDALVAELRVGQPAFAANSPKRPPDPAIAEPVAPVAIKNHVYLGKLSSPSGTIVVGEATAPTKHTFVAEGHAGVWHAYVKNTGDERLVLVHADAIAQRTKLLKELLPLASLDVEGGTMAMICAEVRDDESFLEATMFPVSPIVRGSGCVVRTGGDGAHQLSGAKTNERFALLVVDF